MAGIAAAAGCAGGHPVPAALSEDPVAAARAYSDGIWSCDPARAALAYDLSLVHPAIGREAWAAVVVKGCREDTPFTERRTITTQLISNDGARALVRVSMRWSGGGGNGGVSALVKTAEGWRVDTG